MTRVRRRTRSPGNPAATGMPGYRVIPGDPDGSMVQADSSGGSSGELVYIRGKVQTRVFWRVVWTLALQPESGGPAPISGAARQLQAAVLASFPRLRGARSSVQSRSSAPIESSS